MRYSNVTVPPARSGRREEQEASALGLAFPGLERARFWLKTLVRQPGDRSDTGVGSRRQSSNPAPGSGDTAPASTSGPTSNTEAVGPLQGVQ